MVRKKIWLSPAEMGGRGQEFIQEAFGTNWVVFLRPSASGFEEDLTCYLGTPGKHVIALSAGTAALYLGPVMLGVGRDDEVVCQNLTPAASANPITYQEAGPVFVDSEPDTRNMSPTLSRQVIEDRIVQTRHKPKVIIPVHLYDALAKMDEILAIVEGYDIPALKGTAETFGSEYKGRKCGTLGRYGAFSFNGNRMIITSGGGVLVCPSEGAARHVPFYAMQARDSTSHYQYMRVDYSYRLSNTSTGIGRGQTLVLDEYVAKRRRSHARYCVLLADCPGIEVKCALTEEHDSNYWLSCVLMNSEEAGFTREDLRLQLEVEAIESHPLWKPIHLQPVFAEASRYVDNTGERFFDRGFCLSGGTLMAEEDLQHTVVVIREPGKRQEGLPPGIRWRQMSC